MSTSSIAQPASKMTDRKCYDCIHRREVPGSAHSRCGHPATRNPIDENPLGELIALTGRRSGMTSVPSRAARELNIRGVDLGIRRGWFIWPLNFDPTWLESCDGFELKPPADASEAK